MYCTSIDDTEALRLPVYLDEDYHGLHAEVNLSTVTCRDTEA